MDNESERGGEVMPQLPKPAVTFADHSYPAYSAKQMIAYGAACVASASATTGWRSDAEYKLRGVAERIELQAKCLEGYAESHGHEAKPVPSVFHFQASHFRDLARELLESLPPPTIAPAGGDEG